MGSLLTPRLWRPPSKPPGAGRIYWGHPYARGLLGAWTFAAGMADLVTGLVVPTFSQTQAGSVVDCPAGRGLDSRAAHGGNVVPPAAYLSQGPVTVFWRGSFAATTSGQEGPASGVQAANFGVTVGYSYAVGIKDGFTGPQGNLHAFYDNNGTQQTMNGGIAPTNVPVTMALTIGNGFATFYINGVIAGGPTATGIITYDAGGSKIQIGGLPASATGVFQGVTTELYFWARALSQVEVMGLTLHPLAFLMPAPSYAPYLTVVPAATVPDPPTAVTAVPGNTTATVSWTAPVSNGGATITGYTVTGAPGGTATTSGLTSVVVPSLTNGTGYTFTVTATNSVGTSAASSASSSVTPTAPPTAPGPPTSVTGVAGQKQVTVSWSAPASNGGSAITGYTVAASPGGATATTTGALTATVTGLTGGTAYTFTVKATNAVGTSVPSAASATVTPTVGPAGARQFDVTVNGVTVITDLDIIAEVDVLTADVKTLTASPVSGVLTIGFVPHSAGVPIVAGIEILPLPPDVTSVTPSTGGAGTSVVIGGTGFTGASAVNFWVHPATSFTVNSDTSITAVAPAGVGPVDVTVTTLSGVSTTGPDDVFTYTSAIPTVTGVAPATGSAAGGTTVVITGTNLTSVTAVTFGGTAAIGFTVDSDIQITAVAPPHAAATVDVQVLIPPTLSATSAADVFTYLAVPAPTITAVSPAAGPVSGATAVVVTGSGFTGATAVTVNGAPAAGFSVISPTTITAVTPAGTAGTGDIRVTTAAGVSPIATAARFTYTAPVTGGSVFTGAVGRWQFLVVTTTGSGLAEITSAKSRKVTFDLYKGASASFTINGLDQQAAIPQEIADDLVCLRDGRRLFLGRLGATDDTLDGTSHMTTFAAVDYRGMLDRRIIWPGSRTTFAQVDQRDIAWQLITDTSALGSLGITTASTLTGIRRDRTYNEGDTIGQLITDLSLVIGGFDWEIDAYKSFNVFYPLRGKPAGAGAVLAYGGNVSKVTRTIDTSTFANAVRYSGATGVTAATAVTTPGPEGRWEKQVGDTTVSLASTLTEKAAYELALDSTILPSYAVTLTGGWWTPDLVWLGDYVTLVVKSGRLNITATLRVITVDAAIDDTGHEVVTLTLGQSLGSFFDKLAKYTQRFQNLERR